MILVQCFDPLAGSPAEPLWHEGEASYVDDGRAMHSRVTPPPHDLLGWMATAYGAPAGLQACRIVGAEAHGVLSWVRPAHRGAGVFRAIQRAVDADLAARGVTHIRSWVVDGPEALGMAAAIVARGGAKVGERLVQAAAGPVTYHEYRRPLLLGDPARE